jgi:hypothetical protein
MYLGILNIGLGVISVDAFQSSLSNQYTHLYNEISRLDDRSASSRESSPDNEASLLSSQIKNFIKARISLVNIRFLLIKLSLDSD